MCVTKGGGGMHDKGGMCVAKGSCMVKRGGACVAEGVHALHSSLECSR